MLHILWLIIKWILILLGILIGLIFLILLLLLFCPIRYSCLLYTSIIGDGTCDQCHMHRRNKSVTLADRGLHHKCIRRIFIKGKATGFIGIQRKRPIKEQILCSTFQSISSQTKAHICKCTITGMCKCGIKILLSMYCTCLLYTSLSGVSGNAK